MDDPRFKDTFEVRKLLVKLICLHEAAMSVGVYSDINHIKVTH